MEIPRNKSRMNNNLDNEAEDEDVENQQASTSSKPTSSSSFGPTTGMRNVPKNRRRLGVMALEGNKTVPRVSPAHSVNKSKSKVLNPRRINLLQQKQIQKRSTSINEQQIKEFMRRKESPLANDLILENIFQYCGLEALACCRLVNRQWNSTSRVTLGTKHAPIVFNTTKDAFRFAQVMKKSSNFPYRSFVLKTKYSNRVDKYFENFGGQIKNLQATSNAGKEKIDFQNLYDVLNRTPNLETLDVRNIDFPRGAQFANASERVGGDSLKKLTSLRISGWFMNVQRVNQIQDFSRFIDPVFKRCSQLKSLDLDITRAAIMPVFMAALKYTPALDTITIRRASEEHALILLQADIKFKKVTLNEILLNREGAVLNLFLDSVKDCLEFLSLHIMGNELVVPSRLPRMAALKTLILDQHFPTDILPFENLQNPNTIPFLHKLSINQDFMITLIESSVDFISYTVQDLTLSMKDYPNSGTRLAIQDDEQNFDMYQANNVQLILIQNMPVIFPNLTRLTAVDAKCSAIREIFTCLTGLEELHITYWIPSYAPNSFINLTQTLTGIPSSDWMAYALRDWITDTSISSTEKQTVLNFVSAKAQPSLRSLLNLKILKLSGKLMISEAAVGMALLSIQPLQKLILQDKAAELSSSSLEELRKHHKIVSFNG